jgi:hypothetical protein
VTRAGGGLGWVSSSPAGIACGPTCSGSFELEQVVTLMGTAGSGANEVAWEGCDRVLTGNRCEVKIEADRSVTAIFTPIAVAPPKVEVPIAEAPPPAKKKSNKQLQKALKKCKKVKNHKARSRCVKRAKAKAKKGSGGS